MNAPDALLVLCTCPDNTAAQSLATYLVEKRLAACVTLLAPVQSIYRWQETIEQAEEVQLLIKTNNQRWEALQTAIIERHPYEVPEIVALPIVAGLSTYLDWINATTCVKP